MPLKGIKNDFVLALPVGPVVKTNVISGSNGVAFAHSIAFTKQFLTQNPSGIPEDRSHVTLYKIIVVLSCASHSVSGYT